MVCGEDSMDVQLPLLSDDSYQGPPVSGFDSSRGEDILAFGKTVAVAPASAKEEHQDEDLWAVWSRAASTNGERPKDFGFLCDSFNSSSRSRSLSRSPSAENVREKENLGHEFSQPEADHLDTSNGEFSNGEFSRRRRTRSPSPSDDESSKARRVNDGEKVLQEVSLPLVVEETVEPPRQLGARADKTLMCKFWLKRSCRRMDCNFAHSHAEQREACGRIACRFSVGGSCRDGANCWYKHSDTGVSVPPPSPALTVSSLGNSESAQVATPSKLDGNDGSFDKPTHPAPRERRPFQTGGQQDKTLLCKFWLKRRCLRDDCNFAHSEAEQREACGRIMCRFGAGGLCRQGTQCWYRHKDAELSELRLPETTLDPTPEEGESMEIALNKVDTHKVEPVSRPPSSPALSSQSGPEQQDKTLLCKFWLKHRCTRTVGCKFAHGEAEQRAACKKIRCRYDKFGDCRQGEQCWYLHEEVLERQDNVSPLLSFSTPKRGFAASPAESVTNTPSSVDLRTRIESWADLSDSDDEFLPHGMVRGVTPNQGFPTFVKA